MQKIITVATVLTLVTFSACSKNASETNTTTPAPMSAPDAPAVMNTDSSTSAPAPSMSAPATAPTNAPDATVGSSNVGSSTATNTHMGTKSKSAKAAPTDNSESNRTYPNNDMGGEAKKPKH
jgi:hypothetical protein